MIKEQKIQEINKGFIDRITDIAYCATPVNVPDYIGYMADLCAQLNGYAKADMYVNKELNRLANRSAQLQLQRSPILKKYLQIYDCLLDERFRACYAFDDSTLICRVMDINDSSHRIWEKESEKDFYMTYQVTEQTAYALAVACALKDVDMDAGAAYLLKQTCARSLVTDFKEKVGVSLYEECLSLKERLRENFQSYAPNK